MRGKHVPSRRAAKVLSGEHVQLVRGKACCRSGWREGGVGRWRWGRGDRSRGAFSAVAWGRMGGGAAECQAEA